MRWLSRFPPITKLTILIQILTPPGLIVSHSLICSDNAVMKIMKMTGRWRLPTPLWSCITSLKLFPLANLHPSHWIWELNSMIPLSWSFMCSTLRRNWYFCNRFLVFCFLCSILVEKLAFFMLLACRCLHGQICNSPQSRPWRVCSCDSAIVSRLCWRPPEQTAILTNCVSVQCSVFSVLLLCCHTRPG